MSRRDWSKVVLNNEEQGQVVIALYHRFWSVPENSETGVMVRGILAKLTGRRPEEIEYEDRVAKIRGDIMSAVANFEIQRRHDLLDYGRESGE